MATFDKGFMFGEFDDLSPEEHQRIFNILHGNRRESGTKVEFPWDGKDETTGAVGGPSYEGKIWADAAVEFGYQESSEGKFDAAQFSFMSDEPLTENYNNNVYPLATREQIPSNTIQYSRQDQQLNIAKGQYVNAGQYVSSESVVSTDQYISSESDVNIDATDPNNTMYGDKSGSSSKLQASLKPYERRNKKKRPPDYYKQPEGPRSAVAGHNFPTMQPDLTQPPPNFHPEMRFMPPPGINSSHFVPNNGVRYGHHGENSFPNPAQLQNFPAGLPMRFEGANPQFVTPVILQRNTETISTNPRQETGELLEVVIDSAPPANSVNIPARPETYQIQDHERTNTVAYLPQNKVIEYKSDFNCSNLNENFAKQTKSSNMQRETVVKPTRVDVSVKDALVEEDSSHLHSEGNMQGVVAEHVCSATDSVTMVAAEKEMDTVHAGIDSVSSENLMEKNDSVKFNSDENAINNGAKMESDEQPSEAVSRLEKKSEEVKSNKPVSWAGLFKSSASNNSNVKEVPVLSNPVDNPKLTTEADRRSEKELSPLPVPASEDSVAKELGEHLSKMTISHASVSLQPRGLVNRANWCYIHGTLQALVACPPFYNLLKKLPRYPALSRGPSSTPILDALVEFVHEFQPMSRNFERGQKGLKDISPGESFEPAYIYKMLQALAVNPHFKLGKQEDAEEFLSCVLDGLHEEMSAVVNLNTDLVDVQEPVETEEGYVNGFVHTEGEEHDGEPEEDSWEQVGPKKKSVLTRRANFAKSPISEIFAGMVRSAVFKTTSKETATLEPFFTLQLDIQSEKVWTVKDALEGFVSKEQISGYNCPNTNTEVEVTKKLSLEELPPVLILHLKCFLYDKDGGSQKLIKKVDYAVELEITKDLLSPSARNKLTLQQRSYKLFAVVYHHGKKATGGHYTASVFHAGINGWVNIDDSQVKTVPMTSVLKFLPPRVPYLLYYRRLDSH